MTMKPMDETQFNDGRYDLQDLHKQHSNREKKPKSGRRFTVVFSTVLCLFTIVLFGVDYVLQPEKFPTKHIDVVGNLTNISTSQVATAVAAVSARNILLVDIAKAAEAAQSIPWVEGATIRRKWPDTLEVKVNERVIRAHWNNDQFVDQIGSVVSLPNFKDSSLPHLSGPDDAIQDVLETYDIWNNAMSDMGLEVIAIDLSERGSWKISLNSVAGSEHYEKAAAESTSFKVILGSSDIQHRSKRFLKLYSQVFQPARESVAVIDMRYPDGVSVTWKDSPPQMQGTKTIANS